MIMTILFIFALIMLLGATIMIYHYKSHESFDQPFGFTAFVTLGILFIREFFISFVGLYYIYSAYTYKGLVMLFTDSYNEATRENAIIIRDMMKVFLTRSDYPRSILFLIFLKRMKKNKDSQMT